MAISEKELSKPNKLAHEDTLEIIRDHRVALEDDRGNITVSSLYETGQGQDRKLDNVNYWVGGEGTRISQASWTLGRV